MKTNSVSRIFSILLLYLTLINPSEAQTAPQFAQGNPELLKLISVESKADRKKDEFETTESFKKRLTENIGKEFLVTFDISAASHIFLGPKPFSYNADSQTLTITLRGDSSIEAIKVFNIQSDEGHGISPDVMLQGRYTKFTLAKTGPDLEKTYSATNSMGAVTTVSVYRNTFSAVALLNAPETLGPPLPAIEIKMPPEVASELSKRAKWRLLLKTAMAPAQKSLVLEDGDYIKPTILSPVESYTAGRTITASLLHAELVDPTTNTVVASFGPKMEINSLSTQSRVVLGIQMLAIDEKTAALQKLNGPSGVLVITVASKSVAERAGIQPGDTLIRFGDKSVKTAADVQAGVAAISPGTIVPVSLLRQGSKLELQVSF